MNRLKILGITTAALYLFIGTGGCQQKTTPSTVAKAAVTATATGAAPANDTLEKQIQQIQYMRSIPQAVRDKKIAELRRGQTTPGQTTPGKPAPNK